jgi:hypothetical protein
MRELGILIKAMDKEEYITKEGKNSLKEEWKQQEKHLQSLEVKVRDIYKCPIPVGD